LALSPDAAQALKTWHAAMDQVRARQAAAPPARNVAEELARRIELEQTGRRELGPLFALAVSAEDRQALREEVNRELRPIDDDNLRYLKSVLPADGWFRNSRDGKQATEDAWLIVQHASDRDFQKAVLARMEQLVPLGEVSGPDYALLYDRTEMFEGRPQKYGSQGTCEAGVTVIYKLQDPARVDALRKSVGLADSLADYQKRLGIGRRC
jgi:hypothetical protein